MTEKSKLIRSICFYNIDDDEYAGEIILKSHDLPELQKIFNVEADNLLYECYELKREQAKYFINKYNLKFSFDKYDYFLECGTDD